MSPKVLDLKSLRKELDNLIYNVRSDKGLFELQSIEDLAIMMVRHTSSPLVYILIDLSQLAIVTAIIEKGYFLR